MLTPWTLLYRCIWAVGPFFARRHLKKRARANADYALHWDERFGQPHPSPVQAALWVHAVSVGETRAALPLVRALQRHFPDAPLLLTQMTPTGRATANMLFPDAQCRYLPYDHPRYVAQFLREHRPLLGVLMETELWPHLMRAAQQENIPFFLANARLSERSLKGYERAHGLFGPALGVLTGVFAQTAEDAQRLTQLGARQVTVCGNSKFDVQASAAQQALISPFRQRIGERPVVVCASTRAHQGVDEEALLLDAWRDAPHDVLLVLAPRHPERFDAVMRLAQQHFRVQRRSDELPVRPDTQIWIGDSMGELSAYYAQADVAFVGGSLVDTGCQNIIESAAAGAPTLFGWSTYNFAEAAREAVREGAAIQVHNANAWRDATLDLLRHLEKRHQMREAAKHWLALHQGASECMASGIAAAFRQPQANRTQ